ncbi:Peroxidase 63 [Abeliophyllum distichum]|uniref:peroxidase n=1 Tax=Abeliophyllum distichum TaxID=126358 RepID=A0ABD1TWW3_9LAMI
MIALSMAVTPQSLSPPPLSTRPSAMLTSISPSPAAALMWVRIKSSILLRVTRIEVEFYPYQVVRAKTALELACPSVVSCADIIAVAVQNLVLMIGGPYYTVKLGRKDSLTSTAYTVDGNLPKPTMPMNQIIQIFQSRGFSVREMVALSVFKNVMSPNKFDNMYFQNLPKGLGEAGEAPWYWDENGRYWV